VGALVAVVAASGRMSTLGMLMMMGAVELWRYRQVLLLGAGLGVLLRIAQYRIRFRALSKSDLGLCLVARIAIRMPLHSRLSVS
jgi:hypothetical protein